MEKLIYLLGEAGVGVIPRARGDLRDRLLEAAPRLRAAGALHASATIADLDDTEAERVPQFNASGLSDAAVSLWIDSVDRRTEIEAALAPLAPRAAGYLVTESTPKGEPEPRAGERRPGVALVTTFPKPERLDDEAFYARWHDSHTPLSLEIHPLLRYTRNAVARRLTRGAPPLRAIVTEAVASTTIAADPVAFFGSEANRARAVEDLLSFVDFESLSVVLMSEYILTP